MRFPANSPFFLLVLPALAGALKDPSSGAATAAIDDAVAIGTKDDAAIPKGRGDLPTKDAPVDGRDGKPHLGPFIETDGTVKAGTDGKSDTVEKIKGRPADPTVIDGKKIPESNDGIMFDKNREKAKEGTTGTEGGVSEKDKARKAHEGKTGEKTVTQPESPKEKLPLPHSEEEKMNAGKEKPKSKPIDKDAIKDGDNGGFAGFDASATKTLDHIPMPINMTMCRNLITSAKRRENSLPCRTRSTRTISKSTIPLPPKSPHQRRRPPTTMRASFSLSTPLFSLSP